MGPKKNKKHNKQQEQQDKLFEKKQKKLQQQTSKWAKVLQNDQQQQQFIQKKQVFDFSNQSQYLRKLRQLQQKQLLQAPSESSEQQQPQQQQLSDHQTQEQKLQRQKKQQAKRQKKLRIKRARQQLIALKKKQRQQQALKNVEQEKKNQNNKEQIQNADCFKISLFLFIFLVLIGYLQYQAQIYQRYQHFKVTENGDDLYNILEADNSLTDLQLKAKYKKLVLKYHPDKNKQCKDCKQKFSKIVNAWQILGNQQKRKEYDANNGAITKIKSSSLTLTQQNFHILMDNTDDLWIIQVYDQTNQFCHRYSYIWQQVVNQYKGFVKFARIDVWNQKQMLSYVPYSFSVFPGIYSFYKGETDIYDLVFNNPLDSLKKFIEDKITGTIPFLSQNNIKLQNQKPTIVLTTDRISLPYQIKIISQKYSSMVNLYMLNTKKSQTLSKSINLISGARIYYNSLDDYQDIKFKFNADGYHLIQNQIKRVVLRTLSICKMQQQCSDRQCILIMNPDVKVPKSKYPRIVVKNEQFYRQINDLKNRTMQVQNFEIGLYMDGKITFGYIQDIQDLTLDEGQLINLECKRPIIINYLRIGLAVILIPIILKSGKRMAGLLMFILGYVLYRLGLDFQYL